MVAQVGAALDAPDPYLRLGAADALRWIGADAGPASGKLAECLGDKVEFVRYACATALTSIGPGTVPAIRTFLKTADADGVAAARVALQPMTVSVSEAEEFSRMARDPALPAPIRAAAVFAVSRSSARGRSGRCR